MDKDRIVEKIARSLVVGDKPENRFEGIKSVNFYRADGTEFCDRCGAAIKNVALVSWKDGTTSRFGSECINKILAGDNSLMALYRKNEKILKSATMALDVLSRPIESMPFGSEYYGSGKFFIADDEGEDIHGKNGWFFHPIADLEKNAASDFYNFCEPGDEGCGQKTYEQFRKEALMKIESGKKFFQAKIVEAQAFLTRILATAIKNNQQKGVDMSFLKN